VDTRNGRPCNKDLVMCMMCARQYYQIDFAQAHRDEVKCPNCRCLVRVAEIGDDNQLYVKLTSWWDMMETQDQTCNRCGYTCQSPYDLAAHLRESCPQCIVKCDATDCEYRCPRTDIAAHMATCPHLTRRCPGCDLFFPTQSEHFQNCPSRRAVCPWCNRLCPLAERHEHGECLEAALQESYRVEELMTKLCSFLFD
jgi:hypothetical protein